MLTSFVIATGTSHRQMHAIADEVNRKLKREGGSRRLNIEGYRTEGNWILTDYGDVVLHVFTAEGRALYNLEQLWADAPRIDWKAEALPSVVSRGLLNLKRSARSSAGNMLERAA